MTGFDELLRRAKNGSITQREIETVANELRNPDSGVDPFTLLHILGASFAFRYRSLIEEYLTSPEDPMLARMALEILCLDWDCTKGYLDQVRQFVAGVEWDADDDVRTMAISVAGEYLRCEKEPELLRDLLKIFGDQSERQRIRESAYFALARAVGRDWNDLPSAARHFDLARETDPKVLTEARQRLPREGG